VTFKLWRISRIFYLFFFPVRYNSVDKTVLCYTFYPNKFGNVRRQLSVGLASYRYACTCNSIWCPCMQVSQDVGYLIMR